MSTAILTAVPASSRTLHSSDAGFTRLEGDRGVLVFRPGARNLPRPGEEIEFVLSSGKLRLRVLAETSARRNHSRHARAYVSYSPRRIVKILAEETCSTCSGSGAIPLPGTCPECNGRGCVDCDDTGRIEFSECPTCRGGRK